jgi:hypothetical protein
VQCLLGLKEIKWKWWNSQHGKISVAFAKATLKKTCILEREHATLPAAHAYILMTGADASHVKSSATAHTRWNISGV